MGGKIKIEGIESKKDFKEILKRGSKKNNSFFTVYLRKNLGEETLRVGFIITKKIGNSVERNKIKRIIKESLRSIDIKLACGLSMIFIIRKHEGKLNFWEVREELINLLNKYNN